MAYKQQWGLSRNSKDSIAAVKAWKIDTENYRKRKFRGNNPKLGPITPEENERERISEQSTKYYDTEEQRLKLIPTDDAEIQDENFKSRLKQWQLPPSIPIEPQSFQTKVREFKAKAGKTVRKAVGIPEAIIKKRNEYNID
jgi:hypothetical protein